MQEKMKHRTSGVMRDVYYTTKERSCSFFRIAHSSSFCLSASVNSEILILFFDLCCLLYSSSFSWRQIHIESVSIYINILSQYTSLLYRSLIR